MSNQLSLNSAERSKWRLILKTIRDGREQFWQYVAAVAEAKASGLWREDFKTFDEFCSQEVGWERRYTNQLLEACATRGKVGAIAPTLITSGAIKTESQFRELKDVPEKQMQQVLDKVVEKTNETGEPVTAKLLKDVVGQVTATEPEPEADQYEDVPDDELAPDPEPPPKAPSKAEQAANLRSIILQHNAAGMRATDDLHALIPNPSYHAEVHGNFRATHETVEGWK